MNKLINNPLLNTFEKGYCILIFTLISIGNLSAQDLELNGNKKYTIGSITITGAQSLFGVKTELQFGKTRVTAVFSEQQSETKSVVSQGGGTVEDFDFFGLDYDENRHFFLGHFFLNSLEIY